MARNAKKASDSLQPRRPHRYERLNKHEETPPEIGLWVRGIADGLLMVDQASRCLYANEAFAAFLKTTPEALTGKTVDEFLPERIIPASGGNSPAPTRKRCPYNSRSITTAADAGMSATAIPSRPEA